jgi:hypothetical protein
MKTDKAISSDCLISVLHYVIDLAAFYGMDIKLIESKKYGNVVRY